MPVSDRSPEEMSLPPPETAPLPSVGPGRLTFGPAGAGAVQPIERKLVMHMKRSIELPEFMRRLSAAVVAERSSRHMTDRQMAEYLHISRTHLRNIEHCRRTPSVALLMRILIRLDISMDSLLAGGSGPASPQVPADLPPADAGVREHSVRTRGDRFQDSCQSSPAGPPTERR